MTFEMASPLYFLNVFQSFFIFKTSVNFDKVEIAVQRNGRRHKFEIDSWLSCMFPRGEFSS